ncbi:MAG: hypothetical protein M1830_002856 [Pleopsidium flavum]|nr:MAG: hypothetical protein M1830_002856 [Pleopsidium flavum]
MVGLLVDDDEGPPRARYLRLSRDELETEVGLRGLSAVGDERDDLENGVENVPKMPEVARAKDGTMDETKDEGLPSQVATRPLETTANDREDEERFFSDFTRQLLEASRAHPEKEEIFYSGGTSVQLRAPKDEHQKMDNENGAEARRLKRTRLI